MNAISRLVLSSVRCTICGAGYGQCECWSKCSVCGWSYETGKACRNCAGDNSPGIIASTFTGKGKRKCTKQ